MSGPLAAELTARRSGARVAVPFDSARRRFQDASGPLIVSLMEIYL